ncbi:MAG: M23 family metallopeptidase [Chloroflexia bacterium]
MRSISSAVSTKKTRSVLAFVAAVAVALFALSAASATPASAAPTGGARTPFLSLPFEANSSMQILSGWYYNGGGFHGGIDFVKGSYNSVRSWGTFPVIAAADGEACANCCSRQGNAVFIKHKLNGVTYYTYYGHLASISPDIPQGAQSRTVHVKRGQFLGMAGDTGSRGSIHLHFALMNANSTPMDPYSIGLLRDAYPAPHTTQFPGIGWFLGIVEMRTQ